MKKLFAIITTLSILLFSLPSFGQDFLMTNEPVTTCSGTFYDNGGAAGFYSNSQNVTKTFTSTGNQRLQFTFQNFSTESCCDYLNIYDGPGINATFLGTFKGNSSPGIITSTGNSLTFVFYADGFTNGTGFAATIACAGPVLTPYVMNNGTVNTCSGVFYDSGGQTGNYNNQENITQTFCSGNGQKIQFSFVNTQFSLTTGDTLFAYDGNSTSSPLLAAFVGGSFAETLTSTGTCITFRFKSDFGPSVSQGWQAIISCTSTTPPANVFPMSSGIRGTCGGTFTDDGGVGGFYANSQVKTQTFRSLNGERMRFSFQNFNTESCCDYLQIWDGPSDQATLLGLYAGGNSPGIITSSGNSLTFKFYADGFTNSSGFAATIECLGPALTSYNMSSGTVNTCSGVFYDAGGSVGNYSNFEDRTQTFCSGNSQKIQFNFTNSDFQLSTGDTLFAYDGNSTNGPFLGAYVSGSRVEPLTSTGTCLTFRFKSDFGPSVGKGWQALISCVFTAPAANTYQMSSGVRGVCNGTFTDEGGVSGFYSNSQNRTQTFKSLNGERLRFTFQNFSTESCCDYLQIWDGPSDQATLLGLFAGSNSPGIITSTGNALTFRFYADGFTNSSGFAATIECFETALPVYNMSSGTVNACTGVFYDAGGQTGNYNNQENRTQTFCSGNGQKIQFTFTNTSFNLSTNDTLFAYDGSSVSAPMLGAFVTGSIVETLTSSGTCLTFRFKSDFGPSVASGWQALISCTTSSPAPTNYVISSGIRGVCSGTFTDDGGLTGNYNSSQNKTQTFRSLNNQRLRFTFQSFSTESCCDYLQVWDGPSTSSPYLGIFRGGINPGVITSTGNTLTFQFGSDAAQVFSGFVANIECFGTASTVYNMSSGTVSTCEGAFYDAGGSQGNYPTFENRTQTFCSNNGQHIQFKFNNLAFNVIDSLWVYDGNSVNSTLTGIYINGSNVEPLTSSGTCLTFRFKSAGSFSSGWAALISCVSDVPSNLVYPMSSGVRVACSGTFTDQGGLNGNYLNSQYKTQTFQSPDGQRLRFVFQSFLTESQSDYLEIHDGPSIYYPVIARLSGGIAAGTTFTSTGSSLTFIFGSDGSSVNTGWAASIQCAGPALTTYNMSSGTVNTCGGVFYDNNGGGAAYSPNENRNQTLCSDNGQHVVFDFTNFEIGDDGDSLFVYDGNSASSPLLGIYLGFNLPEKITSEGTCLTFRFKSTSANQWNGWKAIISCSGVDPASLIYPMALGLRATCGGIFADDGGLTANYSNSQSRVQTFQSKAGQRIRFNFQQFALENNYDFLRIYDGPSVNSPLIGIYTGTTSPGIVSSSGNSVTFWFTSNGNTSGNFAATIDCFDQALTAYNMSSGTTTTCSGMFYDNGGVSANYPLAENRTQTFCSGSAQKLQFVFNNQAFRLNADDTLFVYDGNSVNSPLLGYYITRSYVETITSTNTCLTFRFKSDFSSATIDQGWAAQISCTSVTPPALVYPMSTGLRMVCSGIFSDDGGINGLYSNSSYLTQTFQSPTNSRLQFEFTQFRTNSSFDYLEIYDGPNSSYPFLGRFSLLNNPGTILSSGNSLTFNWSSNSTSNETGWIANISCAGPALPIFNMSNNAVNACEGQWFDNGGTGYYSSNADYTQTFCSPTGQRLVFNFNQSQFSINGSDSLWVYDGNSTSSPLKAILTGTAPVETIVSSGSCLTFKFKSFGSNFYSGWSANFSCSDNPPQPDVFVMRNGVQVACSGIFTDDGGPTGNYINGRVNTYTFRSGTAGAKLQFTFNEFSTESTTDRLIIYDGNNTSASLLGTYSLNNNPGIVTSTGGSLTFLWVTNTTTNAAGWKATLACVASVPLVGTLALGPYCAGGNLNIPFTSPNQTAGNVFTAQLSDASGQFNNPVNIGTLSGISSGTIQATLPSGLTTSGNYRIRIIGSAPATTGNPSTPFSILTTPAQPSVISGSASVCAGAKTVIYSVTSISNASNYNWTVPNGASVVSGQGTNIVQIDWGISSGTVSVAASNGCGTGTARNLSVTVNSATAPTGSIASNAVNSQVCEGGSVTFSSNTTAGTNPGLQWLVNGIEFAGANGTQFTLSNLISNVAVSLRVTPTTGCFNPTVLTTNAVNISVNPSQPVSVSISNSVNGSAICAGQSVTFNASAVNGGSAPGYSWRINGNSFTGNSGSSFTSSNLQNGDQVSLVLSSNASCPTPSQAISNGISMVVNPVLVPSVNITSNTGSNQTCAGSTLILTANTSNPGDSPNYQWFQNGNPLTGETNSTFTIPSNLSGTTGFTVRLTSNATCANPTQVTSANFNVNVVSNVAPSVSVTSTLGTGPVCVGTSITFTANPVNGGTTPTYQWRKNNTDIPGQTGSVFTSTTLANNDQITVRMTSNDPCANTPTATSQPVTVSIVSTLPTSATATSSVPGNTICAGTSVTFTANPVNGGSNPTYQWSVNGVIQVGETESTFTTSNLSNNAQVRVRMTSSYSCATPAAVTSTPVVMTVSPSVTPTITVNSTQGNFACAGSSILLVANYTNGGTNPQFQWYFNGSPLTDSNNDSLLTPTGFAGTNNYTVEITSNGSCVNPATVLSSAFTVTVSANVTPSVFVNSSVPGNTLCNGQSVTFTANPTNGGTTPLYQWRINGVNVAGQTSQTFTTSSLSNNDLVTVRLKTSITCSSPDTGISNSQTMTITPNSPAAVTVTNNLSSNTICNGQNVVFTANPVNGGTNPAYQWLLNGSNLPGQTNPTWSSFSLANNDQVSVRITSNSACATPNTATSTPQVMTVNPTITPSVSLSSNPTGVSFCSGTSIQMTAIPINGGTTPVYEWKVNNNVVPGQTGSVLNFVLTVHSTVTATLISNAACANPVQATSGGQLFSVTPPQIVTAQSDTAVCEATGAFQLTASPAGGTWSGAGISSTGTFSPGSTGTSKVYYSVPATGNLCAGRDSVLVTVKSRPVVTFSNQGPFCQTAPAVQLTANPSGGTWAGTGVTASGLFTPATAGAGQTSVLYTATVNGCSSSKVLALQVNAPLTVDVGSNETVCFSTDAFQLNGLPAGGTWSGNGVDADGTFTPGFVTPGSNNNLTYTVTVNGCTASKTKQISVTDFGSPLTVNAGTDQTVCISDASFVLQGVTGAGGSWTGTGVSPDGIFNPAVSGTGSFTLTYTVSFTQSPTCSGTDTKTVTVLSAPQAPSVQSDTVCRSGAATLFANGAAAVFNWYTTSSGGAPITGQVSPIFTTPVLNSTTTYYVSQKAGSCESPRAAVVAFVNQFNNAAFSNSAGLLTAEPANGQAFQWLLAGNPVTGAINGSFTPQVSGDYSVIVRLYGCTDTSAQQFVLVTGINEPNARNPWTLHPNPVQNDLHIQAEGLTEIRVINMLGQCVKTKPSVEGPSTTLWMGDLPAGVYRIELRGPNRMEMQMVIVRK